MPHSASGPVSVDAAAHTSLHTPSLPGPHLQVAPLLPLLHSADCDVCLTRQISVVVIAPNLCAVQKFAYDLVVWLHRVEHMHTHRRGQTAEYKNRGREIDI